MKDIKVGCLFATITPSPPPPCYLSFAPYKLKALFVGLLLLVSGLFVCVAQENSTRNQTLSLAIGSAEGKLSDGIDLNTQNTRGLIFDIAFSDEPLRLAVDYFLGGVRVTTPFSSGAKIVRTLIVTEIDLGARYYFEDLSPVVDLYVGGGLASVSANFKSSNNVNSNKSDSSGSGSGTYFGFGARRVFGSGFILGLDYRTSDAEFELKGKSSNGETLVFEKDNYGLARTSLTLGSSW